MKTLSTLICLIPLSASPAFASHNVLAQEKAPATVAEELPAARTILDRHIELTKAAKAAKEHKTMKVEGTFEMAGMGLEGDVLIITSAANEVVVSIGLGPMGTMRSGFGQGVGWMAHPMGGTYLMKGSELQQMKDQASWTSILKEAERFESLRTVARTTFEGQDCWEIELVKKPAEGMDPAKTKKVRTSTEYYNIESGFQVGTVVMAASPVGEVKQTTVMSDYKDFGGVLFSTKSTVRGPGGEFVITINTVTFDKLEAAAFALPPAIAKLKEAAAKKAEAAEKAEKAEKAKQEKPAEGAGV